MISHFIDRNCKHRHLKNHGVYVRNTVILVHKLYVCFE